MAHVGHRVDYLAGFCCPVGGLVAGKPRVLCHENEIYLSNGSEFVYVYDQEGKVLKVSRGPPGGGSGAAIPPGPLSRDRAEAGGMPVVSPLRWSPSLGLGSFLGSLHQGLPSINELHKQHQTPPTCL